MFAGRGKRDALMELSVRLPNLKMVKQLSLNEKCMRMKKIQLIRMRI